MSGNNFYVQIGTADDGAWCDWNRDGLPREEACERAAAQRLSHPLRRWRVVQRTVTNIDVKEESTS